MKRLSTILLLICIVHILYAQTVCISTEGEVSNRMEYAAKYLSDKLTSYNYTVTNNKRKADYHITLSITKKGIDNTKEAYKIETNKKTVSICGSDGTGVIYGCVEYADRVRCAKRLDAVSSLAETPEMVLRGACIGLQKTEYLPGHQVYEYPYTPENFPWFYDKKQWIEYLDMLVENKMNSLYLWNGHPFASTVRLKDYPFAVEVDEETFKKNEEIFSFLTTEADKRGIFVIQMFYNIILSKPFAEHYGLKTQDRNRPITPLVSDYTRKSIAAFIEKYPNVGLLVCLGEAMDTYDDDVEWMTKTIIPDRKSVV